MSGWTDRQAAVLTGAASGIGAATAERLADRGVRLVLVDHDEIAVNELASTLGAVAVQGDVTDPVVNTAAVRAAVDTYGRLDLLVANAGRMSTTNLQPYDLATVSDETYAQTRATNIDAVVYGIRAALPELRREDGGSAVVMGSLAGLVPYPPDPIYGLTKHAMVGLVRALAQPLVQDAVTISAVCPGFVDTPLIASAGREACGEFPLLAAEDVAHGVEFAWTTAEPGACWVLQPGREPTTYVARGVPGPLPTNAPEKHDQ